MTDARRKTAAKPAPSSAEEARPLVAHYSALQDSAALIIADAATAIEKIETEMQAALAPIEAEMTDIFNSVRAWWAVSGPIATEGKRKSIMLAGCQIGIRTTTPALAVPEDRTEDAIIADLLARPEGAGDYVLTRHALYRPSLIRALRAGEAHPDYAMLANVAGLGVSQREEFFIDIATISSVNAPSAVQ